MGERHPEPAEKEEEKKVMSQIRSFDLLLIPVSDIVQADCLNYSFPYTHSL